LLTGDRIRLAGQEIATLTKDHRFQVKFNSVPVHVENRIGIELTERIRAEFYRTGQRFRSLVTGLGAEEEIIVAAFGSTRGAVD